MKRENRPLGRGLDNLLGEASGTSSINEVNIDSIQPNPDQPRRAFDEESLAELALSIQSIGLVQPITLKQLQDGTYLIISGERRWRACKRAGLSTIPAYIKTADDEQIMEMALIENIQREDLNAIEIALAYHRLLQNSDMKQEDLAKRVGKTRSSSPQAPCRDPIGADREENRYGACPCHIGSPPSGGSVVGIRYHHQEKSVGTPD